MPKLVDIKLDGHDLVGQLRKTTGHPFVDKQIIEITGAFGITPSSTTEILVKYRYLCNKSEAGSVQEFNKELKHIKKHTKFLAAPEPTIKFVAFDIKNEVLPISPMCNCFACTKKLKKAQAVVVNTKLEPEEI